MGAPTNCSVEDLVNCLDKLCLEAPKPISTTSPSSPPVKPPSPKLAPAQVIAGVYRSSKVCHTANRNKDYQCTLDEETEQKSQHKEILQEPLKHEDSSPEKDPSEENLDIPGAFSSLQEELEHHIFVGATNSTTDETLPTTIPEVYACTDADLWKSAVEDELLSLNTNHVYETVQIPKDITQLTFKPVFHIKCDQDGKIE